jgi:tetratricopeptide (TPR) repeat protein
MKPFWKIVTAVLCVAVICGAAITWLDHEWKLKETAKVCLASAEQGDAKAQYQLALLYHQGKGVPQDYAEALRWFRRSAEQGDAGGENGLGSSYLYSRGVQKDYAEALRWYRKSADQGYSKAELNLGIMYYQGYGVPQNNAEAARWYRKAADQGDAYAQRTLGLKGPRLSTWSIINHSIIPLGCLILLIGSLLPGWRIQNRHQRALTIAALLGLTTEGLSLYWVFGAFSSVSVVYAFFFAKNLLAGIFVAMIISLFIPKTVKVALGLFGILFICLNFLLIAIYYTKHLLPVRSFCALNGMFLGISISLAIFLWRRHKNSGGLTGMSEEAASETSAESGEESNE